jgi:prephenate dehydratase
MTTIIGISGNRGSFSEEAATYYCQKENLSDYTIEYLIGVDNVLKALTEGKVEIGIFPIENSNGGIVNEAVHAMSKYIFRIEQMFEINIKHNLLVKRGAKTADVKKIVSHQQALKQCRMYLRRVWPEIELEEYVDTASAAKDLSAGTLEPTCAVIAPRVCAELYDLDILEANIQDLKFNFTTFIAARKAT